MDLSDLFVLDFFLIYEKWPALKYSSTSKIKFSTNSNKIRAFLLYINCTEKTKWLLIVSQDGIKHNGVSLKICKIFRGTVLLPGTGYAPVRALGPIVRYKRFLDP